MGKGKIRTKIVDGNQTVSFYRYMHEVTTDDNMNLIMTHKVPVDQEPVAPVMLVHGLGQNRYSWTLTKRSLENYLVSKGFETFNVELRGHGLSRANGSDYPAFFNTYLNYDLPALIQAITDITQGKKIFYMGHSLGGSIAYCIGSSYQAYFAGIASIGGPFNMAAGNPLLKTVAKIGVGLNRLIPFRMPLQPRVFYIDFIGAVAKYGLFLLDHKKNSVPLQVWLPDSMERDVLLERIEKGFDRTSVNVIKFFFEWGAKGRFTSGNGSIDYEEKIKELGVPILFIVGDRDYAATTAAVQEAYEKAGSEDKIIKVFGEETPGQHWGHLDLISGRHAPEIVWPYLEKWMRDRLPRRT